METFRSHSSRRRGCLGSISNRDVSYGARKIGDVVEFFFTLIGIFIWWVVCDHQKRRHRSPIAVKLLILINGEKVDKMNISDSGQVAQLALVGEDAAGNPAPLDPQSAPVWSIDDASLGAVSVDPVLGQIFSPSGKLGTVNISVSIPAVNAQPALAGSGSLVVIAGSAVQIALSISAVAAPVVASPAPVVAPQVAKT